MACKRVTMKKRPSPSYHAGDCKGLSKKGSDGRTYTSVADKRGIYTWKPTIKSKKATGVKRYITVDNGTNPWIVDDYPKEQRVTIYKNNVDGSGKMLEPIKVTEMKYLNLWLSNPDSKKFAEYWKKGNTVLIQKSKNVFVLVYRNITEFKIEEGDEPIKFMSPIGNNDVPYPYLIGKTNLYMLVDSPEYVPVSEFNFKFSIVDQFLRINEFNNSPPLKPKKLKDKVLFTVCDCRWRGSTRCAKSCKSKKK